MAKADLFRWYPSASPICGRCRITRVGHSVGEQNRLNLRFGKVAAVNLVDDSDKALDEHGRYCHGAREVRNHPEPGLHVA